MTEFFDKVRGIDPIWTAVISLVLAMLIGGIIGIGRGKQGRAAGMRTHILVCLGATLTAMTGMFVAGLDGMSNDPLRIAAQVISGIGFLGVGTILVRGRSHITGLTTAAGLWTVAAVGIALGVEYYEGALFVFVAAVLTATILHRLDNRIKGKSSRFELYIEISGDRNVRGTLSFLKENYRTSDINVTAPRSGKIDNVGIELYILGGKDAPVTPGEVTDALYSLEQVIFTVENT